MQTKLTLSLDSRLIARAKAHAKKRGMSLSQIVADYFSLMHTSKKPDDLELPPMTRELVGAMKGAEYSKDDYYRYLEEKHR